MVISFKNSVPDFHIDAPPSKSIYHRELIVRFLCGDTSHLEEVPGDNEDVRATKAVLRALHEFDNGDVILPCNESGSTLRFMIPVAAAYLLGSGRTNVSDSSTGTRLIFTTKGRLFDRPLDELEHAMTPHGISFKRDAETRSIIVTGEMTPGEYEINASVSSQYISGLIMALTLFKEKSMLKLSGEIKSLHYIELTQDTLKKYNSPADFKDNCYYPAHNGYRNPDGSAFASLNGDFNVEGDWSNGAFLLCMKEFSDITVGNLNEYSRQGDRAILDYLSAVHAKAESEITWDCSDIPDIVPYMAMVAPFSFEKTIFTGIGMLRIKESDRVKGIREQLKAFGIKTEETEDTLTIYAYKKQDAKQHPVKVSSYHDHRMAMSAILLALILRAEIDIDDTDCLRKSFPGLIDYFKCAVL